MYANMNRNPQRSEDDVGSPRAGIMEVRRARHGCWEPNFGPLKEQQVFLNTKASLHPYKKNNNFLKSCRFYQLT